MRLTEALRETANRGEPGYPFEIYMNNMIASNHWHDEIEIIYVENGVLYVNISDTEYELRSKDIVFINKNELHAMYSKLPDTKYYAFVFDLKMLLFSMEDFSQKSFIEPLIDGKIRFFNKVSDKDTSEYILKRVLKNNTEKNTGYMLLTKAALLELLSYMIEQKQYWYAYQNPQELLKNEFLKKIITYIDNRFDEQITLLEISHEFNMSPKYFCRFFKKNFKKTLVEYVNSVRVEKAVKMLKETQKSITEIAFLCGFSNMSYFAKVFKQIMGYTPSEWRLK